MPEEEHKQRLRASVDPEVSLNEVKSRAVTGAASLVLRQIFIRGLGFVGMLILARLLSPEVFGLFAIASFLIVLAESLSTLGLNAALVRRRESASEIDLRTVFTAQLGFVAVAGLGIWFAAPGIVAHYALSDESLAVIRTMALVLVLNLFRTVPDVLLQRRMRFDLIAIAQSLEYVVYFAVAVGLAANGYGIWSLIVATLLRSATGVALMLRFAHWLPVPGFDAGVFRSLLGFAVPIQLSTVVSLLHNAIVPVVIGSLFGVAAVGIVNLARTILDAALRQPLLMLSRVQLRVSGRVQDDPVKLSRSVETGLFVSAGLALIPAGLLLTIADRLVLLVLGDAWVEAVPIIRLLSLAFAAYALLLPATSALKALGDSWTAFKVNLLLTGTALLGTLVLAEWLAATSFGVAMLLAVPAGAWLALYRASLAIDFRVVPQVLPVAAAALVTACVTWSILELLPGFAGLVLGSTIGLVAGLVALALLVGRRLAVVARSAFASRPRAFGSRLAGWLDALDSRSLIEAARGSAGR